MLLIYGAIRMDAVSTATVGFYPHLTSLSITYFPKRLVVIIIPLIWLLAVGAAISSLVMWVPSLKCFGCSSIDQYCRLLDDNGRGFLKDDGIRRACF